MPIINPVSKVSRKVRPVNPISKLNQHSEAWHREYKYCCLVHSNDKRATNYKYSPNRIKENTGAIEKKDGPGRNINVQV